MNNEFNVVGLYDHNAESYKKVREAFHNNNVVGIVHATGTGKSYNALQLAYDNKDKKIIYVVPSNGIIEHIQQLIEENPNLDFERDFPNLEFRTYQSFINLSREEIEELDVDLLILDEFHHIGAPVWGSRIDSIIETHENIEIFGMTAYTVRDRGTSYERDMALSGGNELFSDQIVSRYDICDAMIDGVLPKPIYKTAYTNLIGLESQLEEKVLSGKVSEEDKKLYLKILSDVKKRIADAPSIAEVVKRNIKPGGKYIYFCPLAAEKGVNDIETIQQEALEWFKQIAPEEDIIFYTTTSEMGEDGKKNRDAFYKDVTLAGEAVDGKIRVMFAINQYNEGIHAPNVDGVIMGRGTQSDIIFFEQLGRALSVKGNTSSKFEEYEKYSVEQLIDMCKERDIIVSDNLSKVELIEKLIAPTIIDLTNNFDFIKDLENNLKDRIKQTQVSVEGLSKKISTLSDASFDIEVLNQDLFEMLKYVMDRLTMGWEDKYELAKKYYEYYGNLEIPYDFKTLNGIDYDENGVTLGHWISNQKFNKKLAEERKQLLLEIGMCFEVADKESEWQKKYELAKKYYEHYGNLKIPYNFKTLNGIDYDEKGIKLGSWLSDQKKNKNLISNERKQLLLNIGMCFEKLIDIEWQKKYELAKKYYEHYGNLDVSKNFKTLNGIDYDENGIKLGSWLSTQRRQRGSFSEERKQLLLEIGMRFEVIDKESEWQKKYELAKKYYEHYRNLEIPHSFKTLNGIDYDENGVLLGSWLLDQRNKKNSITEEHKQLLLEIGMRFEVIDKEYEWQKKYELAKKYYEHYGNLEIPSTFKTLNGIDYDENGVLLGSWLLYQRNNRNLIPEERKQLLLEIGMRFEVVDKEYEWQKKYELAKKYYEHYGDLEIRYDFKTLNGIDYDENGIKLGSWISEQRKKKDSISNEHKQLLLEIGMRFEIVDKEYEWQKKYELAKKYYEHYGDLEIPYDFKTLNGIDYEETGVTLGLWIRNQRFHKNLTEERKQLLLEIGMRFELIDKEEQWMQKYKIAKAYFEKYPGKSVPGTFKTKNGIDYDEDGIALSSWIADQKRNKKLKDYQIKLLEDIGIKTNFVTKTITEKTSDSINAELISRLNKLLDELPNEINSEEDVISINQEFSNRLR